MGARYDYDLQLLMITAEASGNEALFVDRKEEFMSYIDKAIKSTLRNVDVSTRYSSDQFLVILTHATSENIHLITDRILKYFHELYPKDNITLNYDVVDISGLKNK